MAMNLNEAEEQRETGVVIPDGTFVHLIGHIRAGGVDGPEPGDRGICTASKTSDVLMLDFEFTVLAGKYAKRKLWQNFVVSGGSLDEKGVSKGWNITKSRLRAMVESYFGLKPDDKSAEAAAKRQVPDFASFDGIEFYAKLGVEQQEPTRDQQGNILRSFPPKNTIDYILTGADPERQLLIDGKEPEPRPASRGTGKPKTAEAKAPPAWGGAQAQQPATQAAGPAWGNAQTATGSAAGSTNSATSGGAAASSGGAGAKGPAWARPAAS